MKVEVLLLEEQQSVDYSNTMLQGNKSMAFMIPHGAETTTRM
jgi:hypothetical protein